MKQGTGIVLSVFSLLALAAGAEGDDFAVPRRHRPLVIMGRDYWPALYKYGDWAFGRSDGTASRGVRFDNPEVNAIPAFRDPVPVYYARRPPPDESSELAVWPKFADNFLPDEPDREILTSNPHPEKPFILWATGKRKLISYGGRIELDDDDYRQWKKTHPNHLYDGALDEWDIDLKFAYELTINQIKEGPRKDLVRQFLGSRPKTRYERARKHRDFYENRKRACYGGDMYACISYANSFHLAGDLGVKFLNLETTNTGEADYRGYRWTVSPMFARGAARQFGVMWEWYVAGYMNGWAHDGKWWWDAVTYYPASAKDPERIESVFANWACYYGPEYGVSANVLRRLYYYAWLNGANFTEVEEWSAQFLRWDAALGKTVLAPRAKDYIDFHEFAKAHPVRGVCYTPVAICVPVAQGYPTWGGFPSDEPDYGYTYGDRTLDAIFHTVVPGFEREREYRKGVESLLANSPYAQMYDVIAPDAASQDEDAKLDVFRSYKAVIVAGDYPDRSFEKALDRFEQAGGRVIRIGAREVPPTSETQPTNAIVRVVTGRERFPALEKIFADLQSDYFPFRVDGDCLYGVNRTPTGWLLYVFNNKGVTKFADTPETVDRSFDAHVTVSSARATVVSAHDVRANCRVAVKGGSFAFALPAGDFAIFELKE